MWKDIKTIVLISVCSAICTAVVFVNPYKGSIDINELILQLSGSSGEFCLGTSLPELVGFMLRMIPNYIVMMVLGNNVYRYFCTASIYIFSRCPNRHKWYLRTVFYLLVQILIYETISVAAVILVTALRYDILITSNGNFLLGYHILIFTMWNFAWTLLINICAIRKGSSAAFIMAMSIQIFLTVCLSTKNSLQINHAPENIISKVISYNPVAHTVVGWHKNIPSSENLVGFQYPIDLSSSIILMLFFCIIVILIGDILIQTHDLILENVEIGVM